MMSKANAPKYVEFFDKIKFGKFVGLVGFIEKKLQHILRGIHFSANLEVYKVTN